MIQRGAKPRCLEHTVPSRVQAPLRTSWCEGRWSSDRGAGDEKQLETDNALPLLTCCVGRLVSEAVGLEEALEFVSYRF